MAKSPIYKLFYPENDKLSEVIQVLGTGTESILRKRAKDASTEIYCLTDNQEKYSQIYYFIYCYLLFYEYFGLPVKPNSGYLLLKNSYEQLKREHSILKTTHQKLLSQTTNAFSGEDIKKLREANKKLKETIQDERNQRDSAQYAYQELKQKYENATETLSKLKEIEDKYNELIETEKANQKKLDEAKKSTQTISDYAKKLLEEKESLEAELEGFKNAKQNKGIAKAFNAKKETETLKKERDKLQQDYDAIKEQYEKAFRSSQDSVDSITALEERNNTLKQQLNEEKAKSKQLEDKLFEKEEELHQQKIVLSNAGSARSDRYSESLDERIKEKDRIIRKLKEQIEQLQKTDQLPKLHKKLNPASEWNEEEHPPLELDNSKLEEFQFQLDTKDSEISQLKEQVSELETQLQNSNETPDYSKELDSLQQQHEEALNQLRFELEQENQQILREKEAELQKLRSELEEKYKQDLETLSSQLETAHLAESQLKSENQDLNARLSELEDLQSEVQELRSQLQTVQEETQKEEQKQQVISKLSQDMKIAVSAEELDNQPDAEFFNVRKSMTGGLDFQESDERRAAIVVIHGKAYPNAYYYRNLLTGQGTAGLEMLNNLFDFENMNNTSVCVLSKFVPAIVTESENIQLLERGKLIMK